ncbi:hypothetical protein [Pseudoxanthomonas sacheonensis]|uniref:Na+-translocating ferredoxin:NAD+ oxidoreductase RnfC subunit n=1 Tax=Pseudoxanthomonas sacheonensis TaxID=443615 RepID=A0ABU1RN89_9GAMM|nr:hypothetical protein [Pseudoxanthomonas sacheonensis]MDR6840238.1 Na+-translocating ferredoxin:NAD+ oxidoreductase RnfC subunit [Pseudoxanthomonas sacheonensis]
MNPGSSDADAAHDCARAVRLAEYLLADDVDAAIEGGLMDFVPCPTCDRVLAIQLIEAQRKLRSAWAARDRYRARNARLAKRAAERDARRAAPAVEKKSALPPAAAAILARAKAKAAERGKS